MSMSVAEMVNGLVGNFRDTELKKYDQSKQSYNNEMVSKNLFEENSIGNKFYDTQDGKIADEIEAIKGEIQAYIQAEQKKLEQKKEEASRKAESEYDPQKHGDDFDAFLEDYLSKVDGLDKVIEVPASLQTRLEATEARQSEIMTKVLGQTNDTNAAYGAMDECDERMDYDLSYSLDFAA